jgi:predicted phage replisome organizer
MKQKIERKEDKKLYFFKFSENFFTDKRIQSVLLAPGGDKYMIMYLKLLAKSLKNGGVLDYDGFRQDFFEDLRLEMPEYPVEEIKFGIALFVAAKLVETDRETFCSMLQVPDLTVAETGWAQIKRDERAKAKALEAPKEEVKKERKKEREEDFEELWSLYPKKRGKGKISDKKKKEIIEEVGKENFKKAIERYKEEIRKKRIDEQYIQMGSTFFNSGYVDYLDENYEDDTTPKPIQVTGTRTDQVLEAIMTSDGVFSIEGIDKSKFIKDKFTSAELTRIYEEYPSLR